MYPDAAGYGFTADFPGHHPSRDACSEDRTAYLATRRRQGASRCVVDAPSGRDQNVLHTADYDRPELAGSLSASEHRLSVPALSSLLMISEL